MVNGNNIFISLDGQTAPFAATKANEIQVDAEKIPISSPLTGEWEQHIVGRKKWSFSVNSLVTALADIKKVLIVGNTYTITVYGRSGSNITAMLQGRATCMSARAGLTRGNLATGSFSFVGNGELCEVVPVTGITLSDDELSIREGTSATIVATIYPSNATNKLVTWASSNNSIATVDDDGNVTAVSEGTCTVTCTSQADTSISASCSVEVLPPVSVESVSVSPSTIETYVGGIVKLTATVLPSDAADKRVTWSSSDNSVATVDAEGNVTCVGQGSCTITCTSLYDNTKTATCSVTVATYVPVESITLSGGSPIYLYIPGDFNLNPNYTEIDVYITPSNASNKNVKLEAAPEGVVSIEKNSDSHYRIRAINLGSTLLLATAEDDTVFSDETEIIVSPNQE